jgi:tetratricopeptide (TPR) repeat protein
MDMKDRCLNEQFLLDVLAGRATFTAEHQQHVDECERCAELFDHVMSAALQTIGRQGAFDEPVSTHLSQDQLLLFYDHGVTHHDSEPIIAHLTDCSQCRHSFLALERELDDYYAAADLLAEVVEQQARQQWQKVEETLAPQPNGHKTTVWEWVARFVRGRKGKEGEGRGRKGKEAEGSGETTRPYSHTPILPYAVGAAAVVALVIIAFLIWRGRDTEQQRNMVTGPRQPRPQVPAPQKPKSPEGIEKPKEITPQPPRLPERSVPKSEIQNPKSPPSGRPSPTPKKSPTQPTQPTQPTTPQGEGHLVERVPVGTFISVMGTPNVRHIDSKTENPKPKTVVYLGDRIYTGDADKADIQFHDGTTLQLNFNTTIEIPSSTRPHVHTPTRPSVVKLLIGNLWTKVQKLEPQSKFEVGTPVATAAVRGTEFGLKVRVLGSELSVLGTTPKTQNPKPKTAFEAVLTVKEGKVEFFNEHGKVEATENTQSAAKADTAPTPPRRLASLKTYRPPGERWSVTITTRRLTFLSGALEKIVFPVGNAGLNVEDVVPETLEQVLAPERKGPPAVPAQVCVVRVPRASAAEKAGLRVGDVITAVNGKPISKALEVNALIATHPKARVALTVMRAEGKRTVTVAVGPPEATQTPKLSRRAARRLYAATRLLIESKTDEAERTLLQLRGNWEGGRRGKAEHPPSRQVGTEIGKLGNRERAAVENNLGVLYETKDEMGEAIRHYQRAVQTEPKVALYRMNLGLTLKNIGNFERAAEELETATQLAPRWLNARLQLALVYELLDRREEGLKEVEAALRLNPQFPYAWRVRSYFSGKEGNRDLLKAVALEPTFASAHAELGDEESLRKAIELYPNSTAAYTKLGIVYKERGKLDEAERLYRKAIEANPQNDNAYISLGDFLRERGRLDEAEETYRKASAAVPSARPRVASAFIQLSNSYSARQQWDEAEKRVNAALQLDLKSADAYNALGNIYRARGQFEEEEKAYRKGIEVNPQRAWWCYNSLGDVYRKREQWAEAEEMYRKAIAVYPPQVAGVVWLYQNLASLLADRGIKLDEALQLAQKVVKAQPGNAAYGEILGWVHYRRGELAEAEAALKKSIELYGQDAKRGEPLGKLGLVYEKKGEREAAREALREALKLDPNNKEAKEGLERLEKGSEQ